MFSWLFGSSHSKLEIIESEVQEDLIEEFDKPDPKRFIVGQNSIHTKEIIKKQIDAAKIILDKIQAARDKKLKCENGLKKSENEINNCTKNMQKDLQMLSKRVPCPYEKIEDEKYTEKISDSNICSILNSDTEPNRRFTNNCGKILNDSNNIDESQCDSRKINDCPEFTLKDQQTLKEKVNVSCPNEKLEERYTKNITHSNACSTLDTIKKLNKCFSNIDGKINTTANVVDGQQNDSGQIQDLTKNIEILQKDLQMLNKKVSCLYEKIEEEIYTDKTSQPQNVFTCNSANELNKCCSNSLVESNSTKSVSNTGYKCLMKNKQSINRTIQRKVTNSNKQLTKNKNTLLKPKKSKIKTNLVECIKTLSNCDVRMNKKNVQEHFINSIDIQNKTERHSLTLEEFVSKIKSVLLNIEKETENTYCSIIMTISKLKIKLCSCEKKMYVLMDSKMKIITNSQIENFTKPNCTVNIMCDFLRYQPVPELINKDAKIYPPENQCNPSMKPHDLSRFCSDEKNSKSNCTENNKCDILFSQPILEGIKKDVKTCQPENRCTNTAKPQELSRFGADEQISKSNFIENNKYDFLFSQPIPEWIKKTSPICPSENRCVTATEPCELSKCLDKQILKSDISKTNICDFLQSQPIPEWIKKDEKICPSENRCVTTLKPHELSKCCAEEQNLKSNYTKNNICDFLQCQPIPEWIKKEKNICPSENLCENATKPQNVSVCLDKRISKSNCTDDEIRDILHSQRAPEKTKKDTEICQLDDQCGSTEPLGLSKCHSNNRISKLTHTGSEQCDCLSLQPVVECIKNDSTICSYAKRCENTIKPKKLSLSCSNEQQLTKANFTKNKICDAISFQPVFEWTKKDTTFCPSENGCMNANKLQELSRYCANERISKSNCTKKVIFDTIRCQRVPDRIIKESTVCASDKKHKNTNKPYESSKCRSKNSDYYVIDRILNNRSEKIYKITQVDSK